MKCTWRVISGVVQKVLVFAINHETIKQNYDVNMTIHRRQVYEILILSQTADFKASRQTSDVSTCSLGQLLHSEINFTPNACRIGSGRKDFWKYPCCCTERTTCPLVGRYTPWTNT